MFVTQKFCRCACTVLLASIFVIFSNHVSADDVFVGKFASLSAMVPPLEANILEIYIVAKGDKYIVTEFNKGEFKLDYLAKQCDPNQVLMMTAPGEVYTLCTLEEGFVKFVYSQKGVNEDHPRRIQNLKDKNGESLIHEQYFIPWVFTFRRVDSFTYAPNDPLKLLNHETSEYISLCKEAGVKLLEKPVAPVRSIAYDFDPKRISGWSGASRVEVDEDGRTLRFGGFSKLNAEKIKLASFEFTERRNGDGAGRATINPSAPYCHFPSNKKPYHGVEDLSADVLAFLDVDKPDEYKKAPISQGAIRYQITLTDRRSNSILGEQVFVVDRLNHRACGVNVANVISPSAFIFDAINR